MLLVTVWFGFGFFITAQNHHNITNNKSPLKFLKYRSGKFEQLWLDNVESWQNDVCTHLPRDIIDSYMSGIRNFNNLDKSSLLAFINNEDQNYTFTDYLSYYDYEYEDIKRGTLHKVTIPIESMIGLLRDPRKCYDETSGTFVQSKEYFLPINGHLLEFLRSHERSRKACHAPQTFLFDCGASFYSDANMQGMKWIIDWYMKAGIQIFNVVGYEKTVIKGDLHLVGVPDWLIPGFQYFNHAVEIDVKSIWNPVTMIKKKCRVDDFVIFKLDIDHPVTEKVIAL